MFSYTPDEDTAQATEGRRVVRPARGRGRGRSAWAGASFLTIGGVSDDSGKSLIKTRTRHYPPTPPPTPTPPHTLFLMLLLTFSLMSSYTPDEDTAQTIEGHRVVRPAHGRGRGRSAKATLATSSSDKCRSGLKPGSGRGCSAKAGATSLTIGAVSEHNGRSHTFPSHPPPPPPLTHTLFLVLLFTFSLMSSYTPDEETGQTTEGRRVVRPAHGRGRSARGGKKSSRAGATSLTIGAGAVSDNSGKSLINTHTRPSTWFTPTYSQFSLCHVDIHVTHIHMPHTHMHTHTLHTHTYTSSHTHAHTHTPTPTHACTCIFTFLSSFYM